MTQATDIIIRPATKADVSDLNEALQSLSHDLGDPHNAKIEDLMVHGFGENPAFKALIAKDQANGTCIGVSVYSPMYSTVRGAAGFYVSDLWVSKEARGLGLGPKLLKAVIKSAPSSWKVGFLKLAVYNDNPNARRFYDRLGFKFDPNETYMTISGRELEKMVN
ncbi:MAG: GNAT family N-acetyltransferase [Rhodobacteraceae bacterium]|nr:GNAT family N-acetyltransferase [Paracoccaceae bacterium]